MDSWLDINPSSDFSLANLPFGIITRQINTKPHAAVAVGDQVLDLHVLSTQPAFLDVFPSLKEVPDVFSQPTLNAFAALGRPVHREVRATIQGLLQAGDATLHPDFLRDNEELRKEALILQRYIKTHIPMAIGDYTDFYVGLNHARTVGTLFRGADNALQPNYGHLPVGYHGRASSVVVSGTGVKRPWGQILVDSGDGKNVPSTAPCRKLDFELELGCFIATPNALGDSVSVDDAEDHIFGYVLLNDWSARDIQSWESAPLGPFNSKNFASTVSPWVVLTDALVPFQVPTLDPLETLQPYLKGKEEAKIFNLNLTVDITTPEGDTTTITRVSSKNLLYSFPQMIAHHTLGGCGLRTGDLLGSGTISGPKGDGSDSGCFLEMNRAGQREVMLYGMDARYFLKDGDTITMRGSASLDGGAKGGARVGFGECTGRVYSAAPKPF